MSKRFLRHLALAGLIATGPALATPQGEAAQAANAEGAKTFSQQDLDTILARQDLAEGAEVTGNPILVQC